MTLDLLPRLSGMEIVLASGSPRRRELLAMLDIDFSVAKTIDIDETYPADLNKYEIPEYLSRLKAEAYRSVMHTHQLFITADTIVLVDDRVLGKPKDAEEAVEMLNLLSGRTHQVVTGVALSTLDKMTSFSAVTEVEFSHIPADEIRTYVERYHPFDKAGAYGIQEWIGAVGIRSIEGSFYNVMGLPVHRLWEALKAF